MNLNILNMNEVNRSYSETKPEVIQYLGKNTYYYNYDIQEEEKDGQTVYSYIPVKLVNKPDYKRCVRAIIRKYVDIDEEFDLINTFAAQLLTGTITLSSGDTEYQEYINLVASIKEKVAEDFK